MVPGPVGTAKPADPWHAPSWSLRPQGIPCNKPTVLSLSLQALPGLQTFSSLSTISISIPPLLPYTPNRPVIYCWPSLQLSSRPRSHVCTRATHRLHDFSSSFFHLRFHRRPRRHDSYHVVPQRQRTPAAIRCLDTSYNGPARRRGIIIEVLALNV